jgi:hypothetical protein
MKYVYLSLAFCISTVSLAQNPFDQIVAKNSVIRCEDVQFNAYKIITGLYERKQTDSLYQFIDYWEGKCGHLEMSFRLRALLDIESGRFNDQKISADWIEYLISYKALVSQGEMHATTWEEKEIYTQLNYLNTFLYNYARSIIIQNYSLDAKLLLDFYASRRPTFESIASTSPDESRLSEFYHHEKKRTERTETMDILFNLGYYHPFGKLERFGGHPVFGIGYVYNIYRHAVTLQLDFRAGPSKRDYTVIYLDSAITQRKWTGMYVGLEYSYDLIKKEKFSFAVSPGLGYDGITVLNSENEYGEDSKALGSVNASIGVVGRYRYRDDQSLGLQLRLNWADYHNPGGTPLKGGYITLKAFWTIADGTRTSYRRYLMK